MIRTTAVPPQIRAGVAAASVVGVIALTGCAATGAPAEPAEPTDSAAPTAEATADATADAASGGVYADGSYTAEGSYSTPESVETITVTVTLDDDVITAVEVSGNPTKQESEKYQSEFIGGIGDVVIGRNIDEISVSRVAGSSLTSGGFNQAIAQIRSDAAA